MALPAVWKGAIARYAAEYFEASPGGRLTTERAPVLAVTAVAIASLAVWPIAVGFTPAARMAWARAAVVASGALHERRYQASCSRAWAVEFPRTFADMVLERRETTSPVGYTGATWQPAWMSDMPSEPTTPPSDTFLRGRSVELFSELESALDSIISGYYTPRHPLATHFYLDFLASENFSFGLRRDIFEQITRRHGWFEEQRMNHLRKASRWRNFLAHATLVSHDYSDDETNPKIGIRDPKSPHKPITVADAFAKFESDCKLAVEYAWEVHKKCFPSTPFGTYGHIVELPDPRSLHPSLAAAWDDEPKRPER